MQGMRREQQTLAGVNRGSGDEEIAANTRSEPRAVLPESARVEERATNSIRREQITARHVSAKDKERATSTSNPHVTIFCIIEL